MGGWTRESTFWGSKPIAATFQSLSEDLTRLNYIAPGLLIANKTNWVGDAERAVSSLSVFHAVNANVKTQNGNGEMEVSQTLSNLTPNITSEIGEEFYFLSNSLRYLNDSVASAAFFTSIGAHKVASAVSPDDIEHKPDHRSHFSNLRIDHRQVRFLYRLGKERIGGNHSYHVLLLRHRRATHADPNPFYLLEPLRSKEGPQQVPAHNIGHIGTHIIGLHALGLFNAFASGSVCAGIQTLSFHSTLHDFVAQNNLKVGSVSATTGKNGFVEMVR